MLDTHRPVAIITGTSSGIGKETARRFVHAGWQVVGTGRDPHRCASATTEIAAAARDGGAFTMLRADFTSMPQVQRTAQRVRQLTSRIDVLINNAGGVRDRRVVGTDGTEATFAVNCLAPYLLTCALLPVLRSTAAHRTRESVRILTVSSTAHRATAGLDWDDLQSIHDFQAGSAYCRAKLASILFTRELARRVEPDGIVAHAMHPGVVDTNFATHGDRAMQAYLANAETVAPDEPAQTLVWLATDPAAGGPSGRYFHRNAEETPSAAARDQAAARRLWDQCARILATSSYRPRATGSRSLNRATDVQGQPSGG
ncbi:MAG: SDR family NAD(P)-dependent oxidoreductase [Nocardia sp.]|nr:SDR family NAD(P)-dependent oxidoreductase [Nocardia sp.]